MSMRGAAKRPIKQRDCINFGMKAAARPVESLYCVVGLPHDAIRTDFCVWLIAVVVSTVVVR